MATGAQLKVVTATFAWDGASSTITPEVRRGFLWLQPITRTASGVLASPPTLSCAPVATPEMGGRYIFVTGLTVSGNFSGACSNNISRLTAADASLTLAAKNACGGKTSCVYDATMDVNQLLSDCNPTNVLISYEYRCSTLTPAPAFVFEHATGPTTLTLAGLDGLGLASCQDRGASFFVNGARWQPSTAPCTIDITSRTEHALAGTVTATLLDPANMTPHTLSLDFRHDTNGMRPSFSINTGTDLCGTNTVTRTTQTVGLKTYDVFTTGPLQCQAAAGTMLPPYTLRREVPTQGAPLSCGSSARITIASATHNTDSNGCGQAFVVSETATRLRYVFYNVSQCTPAGDCLAPLPIVAFTSDVP